MVPVHRNSFRRRHRMPNASSFKNVFNGAKWRSGGAELLVLASPNQLDHARLGLVVAKKNQSLAVDRNKSKRVIREAFRQTQASLPAADFVVLTRSGIRNCDRSRIQQQADKHLQKICEKASTVAT